MCFKSSLSDILYILHTRTENCIFLNYYLQNSCNINQHVTVTYYAKHNCTFLYGKPTIFEISQCEEALSKRKFKPVTYMVYKHISLCC